MQITAYFGPQPPPPKILFFICFPSTNTEKDFKPQNAVNPLFLRNALKIDLANRGGVGVGAWSIVPDACYYQEGLMII